MKTDNTFFLIGRIKEAYSSFLENELKNRGLKGIVTSHGDILSNLLNYSELSMSDIADKINRDRSTVTALITKLDLFGYVSLRKSEFDSRSTMVSLTEKGLLLRPDFETISNSLFDISTKDISEEEWQNFRVTLEKLYSNLL